MPMTAAAILPNEKKGDKKVSMRQRALLTIYDTQQNSKENLSLSTRRRRYKLYLPSLPPPTHVRLNVYSCFAQKNIRASTAVSGFCSRIVECATHTEDEHIVGKTQQQLYVHVCCMSINKVWKKCRTKTVITLKACVCALRTSKTLIKNGLRIIHKYNNVCVCVFEVEKLNFFVVCVCLYL